MVTGVVQETGSKMGIWYWLTTYYQTEDTVLFDRWNTHSFWQKVVNNC